MTVRALGPTAALVAVLAVGIVPQSRAEAPVDAPVADGSAPEGGEADAAGAPARPDRQRVLSDLVRLVLVPAYADLSGSMAPR